MKPLKAVLCVAFLGALVGCSNEIDCEEPNGNTYRRTPEECAARQKEIKEWQAKEDAAAAAKQVSKYTKQQTIDQYIVFLRMLKADGASSDGMGGLETRSRAKDMLEAAGFDPGLMENSDRADAWKQVFGG